MDEKILKIVLMQREKFVPLLFTAKQINVLHKYQNHLKLANAEKKALYTSIKRKMNALETFEMEKEKTYYITNADRMIPERLDEAKKTLEAYVKKHQKVFISGSFLFSENYGDIDVFIIREKGYKEEHEAGHHLIYVTMKKLQNPVFQSAAKISVSSFLIPAVLRRKPLKLHELMSSYHEAIIEILDKKKREMTRYLVFRYYLHLKDVVLDGKKLKEISESITLNDVDALLKEILTTLFSPSYLYVSLHEYVKGLNKAMVSEKNIEHLKRYKSVYEDIIHESRRGKAEAA